MIEINGFELEFDLLDADTLDALQYAVDNLQASREVKTDKIGDMVRQPCLVIDKFFDDAFGEGAAADIFGGTMNIKDHMDAFVKVVTNLETAPDEINRTMDEYTRTMNEHFGGNVTKFEPKKPKAKPASKKKYTSKK